MNPPEVSDEEYINFLIATPRVGFVNLTKSAPSWPLLLGYLKARDHTRSGVTREFFVNLTIPSPVHSQ
ncbi:MAG: hypothetical protein M3R15_35180 [Acidobacteriota bacterium]|nr:hypothetical protein [Acidobacteriota bacterium]